MRSTSTLASPDLLSPFRVAFRGVIHTFRTQRHMRIHLYVTFTTLMAAMFFQLPFREILVLLFMITFVLVAEMFNSAIEATVDLASPNYHPLAKFAKDIAAGAVLITTIMAIIVGSLIALGDGQWERIRVSLMADGVGLNPVGRIIVGLALVLVCVIIGKGIGSRGQVLQGGLVSGHAAIGFFLATASLILADNVLVGGIAILLAAIIAQSRLEAKFHSIFELALGATVGVTVGIVLFALIPK
ncbi:diacylglycerol kinase [bacterium]|nr:diacylglycerol kinase [bacterium]